MAEGRKGNGRALSRRGFLAGCTVVAASFALGGCAGGEGDEGPAIALFEDALDDPGIEDFVRAESQSEVYEALHASLAAAGEHVAAGEAPEADFAPRAAQLVARAVAGETGAEDADAAAEDPAGLYAGLAGDCELSCALDPHAALVAGDDPGCLAASEDGDWLFACDGADFYAIEAAGAESRKAFSYNLGELDELSRWEQTRGVFVDGDRVAVAGQLAADADYAPDAEDCALASYAAPRAMLAFFDVSAPDEASYLGCLGLTGSLQALDFSDGVLALVCAGPLLPAAAEDGGFSEELDAEGFEAALGALELREDDPFSWLPALFLDGNLEAFPAERIYLPASGQTHYSLNLASFDLASMSCTSVLALCAPAEWAPSIVCGEGALFACWEECSQEEDGEGGFSEDALVARIGLRGELSGMDCARLAGSTASLLSGGAIEGLLVPADPDADGTALWRLARTRLSFAEGSLSAGWTLQAFDGELAEIMGVDDVAEGRPIASFAALGGAFCLLSGEEEPALTIIEASAAAAGDVETSVFDGDAEACGQWPAWLLALDEDRFLACGNELARLAADGDWAALAPAMAGAADADGAASLRVLDLSTPAAPAFGEAAALDEEAASALRSAGSCPLALARSLNDLQLIALPIIPDEGEGEAFCLLISASEDGSLFVALSLGLAAEWADAAEAEEGGEAAYSELAPIAAQGAPYLFCRGEDALPRIVAVSADGMELLADFALAEQVQLAE